MSSKQECFSYFGDPNWSKKGCFQSGELPPELQAHADAFRDLANVISVQTTHQGEITPQRAGARARGRQKIKFRSRANRAINLPLCGQQPEEHTHP